MKKTPQINYNRPTLTWQDSVIPKIYFNQILCLFLTVKKKSLKARFLVTLRLI